jgi:hypothetical protein
MVKKYLDNSLQLIGELIYNNVFTITNGAAYFDNKKVSLSKNGKEFDIEFKLEKNERSHANNILVDIVPQYSITNEFKKTFLIPEKRTIFDNINDNLHDYRISISGKIHQIQTPAFSPDSNKFQRLFIPIDRNQFAFNDFEVFQYTADIDVRNKELIKLQVNENEFHFYTFKIEDRIYWCVDSTTTLPQIEFRKIAFSIMNVYGFLKGDLFLNESYYISSDDIDFTKNLDFQFVSIRDSLISGYGMFTTNAYSVFVPYYQSNKIEIDSEEIKKWSNQFIFFKSTVFSKLVELFLNEDKFSRASLIILEANNQPLELKAASYCVAFEAVSATIKDLFGIESRSVIEDAKWNNEIRDSFTTLLDSLKSEGIISGDEHRILSSKLYNWNSPTNRDKLTAPFKQFGYELSKDEYKCVDGRNKFLHGSLPVNERDEDEVFQELYHISLTLHKLVYVLMLKAAGFEGFIINYPKMHAYITRRTVEQHLFIAI